MTARPSQTPVLHVANYCRANAQGPESIWSQKAAAHEWCERHLGDQPYHIAVYADEGMSGALGWKPPRRGSRAYRPELARLVADLEAGRVDLLLVDRPDRLARSLPLWVAFVARYCADGERRFVSVSDNTDLVTDWSFARDLILQLRTCCPTHGGASR